MSTKIDREGAEHLRFAGRPVANTPAAQALAADEIIREVLAGYADVYQSNPDGPFQGRSVAVDLTVNVASSLINALRAALASPQEVAGVTDARTFCAMQSPGWAVTRDWEKGWDACRAQFAASRAPVAVGVEPTDGAQNPKFTMGEWSAHARKHRWRFDIETPQNATPSAGAGGSVGAEPQGPGYIPWLDKSLNALSGATPAPSVPLGGGERTCLRCGGEGSVQMTTSHLGPDDYDFTCACPACNGTGSGDLIEVINSLGYWQFKTDIVRIVVERSKVLQVVEAFVKSRAPAHPLQAQDAAPVEPVGVLCVSHHLGDPGMENTEYQPMRTLPPGNHLLFLRAENPKSQAISTTCGNTPVYLIRPGGPRDEHDATWSEATKEAYDLTPDKWRRLLYLAPVPAGVQGDAARLEWMLHNLSGSALRQINVIPASGGLHFGRIAIDAAIAAQSTKGA